ncbi:MAG: hypothetical protein KGJ80_17700, partial [Chloroflexota bacterium]|nr:hypothetical protein [Chloroflexota bacterium]
MRKAQAWNQPCPNSECKDHQQMNRGNIRAGATYLTASGKRRIFHCKACGENFSETRDTVFFDLRTPEEQVMLALKMLLVRVDLSGVSFVLGVTEETVLEWLSRAAQQAERINQHLLRELAVTEIQLDELWNFIARKHSAHDTAQGESQPDSSDGRQWVWLSYAPQFRLIVAAVVGPRCFESAVQLIRRTAASVLGIPCFFSDGFSTYLPALIKCYHVLTEFARTGKRGRPKNPIQEPHPELVYAQVIKEKEKGRLKTLTQRVGCGAER